MAETHLQVNHNGMIIAEKTNILINNKNFRQEELTKLFSINNWHVSSIENVAGCQWKIITNNGDQEYKLNVFFSTIRDEARQSDEFKTQFGTAVDPSKFESGWINLPLGVYVKNETDPFEKWILACFETSGVNFSSNPSLRGVRTQGLQTAQAMGIYKTPYSTIFRPEFIYAIISGFDFSRDRVSLKHNLENTQVQTESSIPYLRAMRTKPFLLLAGISGTGKSRIVKQMAFDCCPDNAKLRKDQTTPGNYCLVEVKPNWHDSSELMGYESQIGHPHYVATTFVRFLAKAMLYEDQQVPFFVCLDEMNLAPVEQYFAEFLSVLESRKVVDGKITSEALIPAEIFANAKYERQLKEDLFGLQVKKVSDEDGKQIYDGELADDELAVYNKLKEQGLRIPSNLIVIGTVNMDETTHQFSRKVIDRAMTIEMNLPEGDPFMDFFNNARDLEYTNNPISHELFLPTLVKAADVVAELEAEDSQKTSDLKMRVANLLTELNEALNDTPFKIAYRVQNELMLYFHELWLEDKSRDWNEILRDSVDQILMMKVLPRVEGDEDLLEKPLASVATFCATGNYTNASKKVEEMQKRLERAHFTSYWP